MADRNSPPGKEWQVGQCWCGCGNITGFAKTKLRGYNKGDRLHFFANHNRHTGFERDIQARLFSKMEKKLIVPQLGPCWSWTGDLDRRGYGRIGIRGRHQFTHNVAYREFIGPIPAGLEPDHLCCVHACFNPDHLEAVTQAENCRRRKSNKLTHMDVAAIRASSEQHKITAVKYGVHPSTICDIRNNRRWNYEGRSS